MSTARRNAARKRRARAKLERWRLARIPKCTGRATQSFTHATLHVGGRTYPIRDLQIDRHGDPVLLHHVPEFVFRFEFKVEKQEEEPHG